MSRVYIYNNVGFDLLTIFSSNEQGIILKLSLNIIKMT